MVRKLFVVSLFISILSADLLEQEIKELVDYKNYQRHQNLINIIFKDKNLYYINTNRINYTKVIDELKNNQLLNIDFGSNQQFLTTFTTNSKPMLFLKNISSILSSLGFSQFITKSAKYLEDGLSITILLESSSLLDPQFLLREFEKRGSIVIDISKNGEKHLEYKIDGTNMKLADTIFLDKSEQITLNKPIQDYWIEIKNGSKLVITPNINDSWFPSVVCYDSSLNELKIEQRQEKTKRLSVDIPSNTKYVKISDIYSLNNIKRGLNIKLY